MALILGLTGALGFALGYWVYPCWQVAVQVAQVVAGIVQYPPESPYYLFSTKAWTLFHQICALFLSLGFSEKALSLCLSGVMGAISFQALGLAVFALSGHPFFACLFPLFIFTHIGPMMSGLTYDVMLLGSEETYGAIGLSLILLVISLLAAEQWRLSGLLLGIAPAVHPILGTWCNLVVGIYLMGYRRSLPASFRKGLPFLLMGYGVSTLSLAIHLGTLPARPPIPAEVTSTYFFQYIRYWDEHRRRFPLFSNDTLAIGLNLFMSFLWLFRLKDDLPRDARVLLASFAISGGLAAALTGIHWFPPERIPPFLLVLMPARLLNFNLLGFNVLLFGLLTRYRDDLWVLLNLSLLVVTMALAPWPPVIFWAKVLSCLALMWSVASRRLLAYKGQDLRLPVIRFYGALFILGSLFLLAHRSFYPVFFGRYSAAKLLVASLLSLTGISLFLFPQFLLPKGPAGPSGQGVWSRMAWVKMTAFFPWAVMAFTGIQAYGVPVLDRQQLIDFRSDPLFAEASKGKGLILNPPGLEMMQIRARRPVLLDGGKTDFLPYVPEAGPEMNRILRHVYGVDLFHPSAPHRGEQRASWYVDTKALWEHRTPEGGRWIKEQFGVTQVITKESWRLHLPEIIRSRGMVLYRIPEAK